MIIGCARPVLQAQVQINFQPAVNGKTLDGLTFFQVNNQAGSDFGCMLRITVQEDREGKVAEINTKGLYVRKGFNTFNRSILEQSQIMFGRGTMANIFRQTGKLPEGTYEYCYELTVSDSKTGLPDNYENCFHLDLKPLTPLLLVDPVDEEKICNRKPAFIWQPPMPLNINAKYRIIVAEVKDNQTPVEALSMNMPVINVAELSAPRLNYPMNIKELDTGKTYVWQVAYSVNNWLVSKSEIWTFKVECEEEKEGKTSDSYRELKVGLTGDYYLARRTLKFAINNAYNGGDLKYTITSLAGDGAAIKHLPILKLITGANKYELNLFEHHAFKDGEQYLLTVELPNSQQLYLRFTYQD